MARPRCYETNAAKQRAYRERKKNFPVTKAERSGALAGDAPKSGVPFTTKKVGELRMIVMPAETGCNEATLPVVKPLILRDDYGRIISEAQWKRLQEKKEKAKENGYVIDDYSQ